MRRRRDSQCILLAGGGTGGHLYPGIAVAREILRRDPARQVVFAGTSAGLEASVVPREGFELELIRSGGLKGKSLPDRLRGAATLPLSALDGWAVVSRRTPAVVIGLGGYSSGPIVLMAAVRRIPTMVMEQNAAPGLTNRLLAKVVRAAAVTYEVTLPSFGRKGFVSGNPVRSSFFETGRQRGLHPPSGSMRILIFGGSQGAHAINVAMIAAAPVLARSGLSLTITHQTGARDLEIVREGYRAAGLDARVEAFLYDMDREMGEADIVVSRAGATTLAELAAAGSVAIVVPFPFATDDHQRRNAEVLAGAGAAEWIDQTQLTGDLLAARLVALARNPARRSAMAAAVRSFARPDAAAVIVDRAFELAGW